MAETKIDWVRATFAENDDYLCTAALCDRGDATAVVPAGSDPADSYNWDGDALCSEHMPEEVA